MSRPMRFLAWWVGGWVLVLTLATAYAVTHPIPAVAIGAWADVQRCSGISSGKSLLGVTWRVRALPRGTLGRWSPPDTITLDPSAANDSLTVEHELLHYLLADGGHPPLYFIVRCHLIPAPVGG